MHLEFKGDGGIDAAFNEIGIFYPVGIAEPGSGPRAKIIIKSGKNYIPKLIICRQFKNIVKPPARCSS